MGDVRLPEAARKDPTKPRTCTPLKVETAQSRKAATIVDLVFRELQFDYRELSHALTILKPQAVCEKGKPSTDGEHYFYDPDWVIEHARKEGYSSGYLRASVLHIVIHGLLGHFAEHVKYRRRNWIWDVMDLQVHELLKEIREEYYIDGEWDKFRDCEKQLKGIHDYGLYYEACRSRERRSVMKRQSRVVGLDDHCVWPVDPDLSREGNDASGEGSGNSRVRIIAMRWEEARGLILKESPGMEDMMEHLASILITGRKKGHRHGTQSANGAMECRAVQDASSDYKQRLLEFAQMSEQAKETDSIDPMLYEYGLQLYENMPLIEPPEVSDTHDLKSIVLAIDTSGSCAEAAGRFLGETNQLFEDIGAVGRIRKLHYLECDAKIQKELTFDSAQSLKQVQCRDMFGWGGTDFRPVFRKASDYIRNGEEISLLIYLSDGCGPFVQNKPEYPVWFVMMKEDFESARKGTMFYTIPDWVTTLCLN